MIEPLPLEDAPPRQPRRRLWPKLVFALICAVLALGTFAVMRYRNAAVPEFAYREFTAPDGSCKATLIGETVEGNAQFPPGFLMLRGGMQFTATHWSTRVGSGLRWHDLDMEFGLLRSEDAIVAEVSRREKELNAKVEKEAVVRWNEFNGREVHFVEGNKRTIERYIFVNKGPRPRLYVIGIGGGGLSGESESIGKVLNSFKLN